jgi:hypothetical protein
VIGLIVRDLTSPFYAELTAGLTEALEAQGRMVFLLHGGREADQLLSRLDMLLNQGVDGVIVAGASGVGSELCERAAEKGVPLVFASRASYLDEADTLRPDNMQAAQMLTEHLIRRGHQRIAWLGGKSSSLTRAERVGGYCATLIKYGLPFHSEWVVECESSQKMAAEAIGALLRSSPTISAVICYNDVIAMGAWFGLIRAGRQSGEGGWKPSSATRWRWGRSPTSVKTRSTICRSSGPRPRAGDGLHAGGQDHAAHRQYGRSGRAPDCGGAAGDGEIIARRRCACAGLQRPGIVGRVSVSATRQ